MQEIAIVVPLPPDASKKDFFSGEGGVSSPECVYCPNPQFSAEAEEIKLQGTVLLDAIITAEGSAPKSRSSKGWVTALMNRLSNM